MARRFRRHHSIVYLRGDVVALVHRAVSGNVAAILRNEYSMQIWVDADACPGAIKEILFRAAERTRVKLTLVANQFLSTPPSRFIHMLRVSAGFDVADDEIVKRLQVGDLVITADIPLAAEVVEKGCTALSPRGELFSVENIRSLLNMRDFMDTMRSSGVVTGGPPSLGQKDRKAFADNLDKILSQHMARNQA